MVGRFGAVLLGMDQPLAARVVLPWAVVLLVMWVDERFVVVVAGVSVVVGVVKPLRMFLYVGELALSDRRLSCVGGDMPLGGRLSLLISVMLVGMMM